MAKSVKENLPPSIPIQLPQADELMLIRCAITCLKNEEPKCTENVIQAPKYSYNIMQVVDY